ncbi:MAG: tetratricopeptide repeat protein, partial [Actinomadura sp.]
MSDELTKARELMQSGDVDAVMRQLRFDAAALPIDELAGIVRWAAKRMGFDALAQKSSALAAAPGEPQALYDFGYACIEHGAPYVAVPALTAALQALPGNVTLAYELVAALEAEHRHAEAVTVLDELGPALPDWPGRYL